VVGLHLLLYFDLASLFARVYESAIGAAAALLAAYFVLPIYATDPVLADTRFVVHLRNAVAELWPDDRPWLVPNSAERLDQSSRASSSACPRSTRKRCSDAGPRAN
jgi:hypothetical protein